MNEIKARDGQSTALILTQMQQDCTGVQRIEVIDQDRAGYTVEVHFPNGRTLVITASEGESKAATLGFYRTGEWKDGGYALAWLDVLESDRYHLTLGDQNGGATSA